MAARPNRASPTATQPPLPPPPPPFPPAASPRRPPLNAPCPDAPISRPASASPSMTPPPPARSTAQSQRRDVSQRHPLAAPGRPAGRGGQALLDERTTALGAALLAGHAISLFG
ncbi:hypothetical protein PtB15_6B334 [Puccinia triticina]|nr:hypothetical protein PtB15_6B334 [Puccinia triticina]